MTNQETPFLGLARIMITERVNLARHRVLYHNFLAKRKILFKEGEKRLTHYLYWHKYSVVFFFCNVLCRTKRCCTKKILKSKHAEPNLKVLTTEHSTVPLLNILNNPLTSYNNKQEKGGKIGQSLDRHIFFLISYRWTIWNSYLMQ